MMETEYLDIKHDCMWSGNCDRKCSNNYKMESLMGKSPFPNENLDLYLNLFGSQAFGSNCQDSIELLDSLDSEDFNIDFILNDSTNAISNNVHRQSNLNTIQPVTNYQFQPNYSLSNQVTNTNHLKLATSSSTSTTNFNNQITTTTSTTNQNNFQHLSNNQSSSVLNSSLNASTKSDQFNDLLLSSTSANIILTQHNHSVDSNSQMNFNQPITNYTPNNLDNLSNLNNLDLIQNSNQCTELVTCESDDLNGSLDVNHTELNPQNHLNENRFHSNYTHPTHHNTMMSNYPFDNHLIDSNFCGATDSASSSNSECSSACLLERTDYDTDDIEDDLDLLEDIIEEEFDDSPFANQTILHTYSGRTNCRSIANSVESSSDVDMSMSSPISDSLINDHSYGASSIEKAYDKISTTYNCKTLLNNVTITTNSTNHRMSSISTPINHNNRISRRKSSQNFNQNTNMSNGRRNMQRCPGTSLLMKEKQMKMKKVMDTDRRKEHNESERMRRDVLKNAFLSLRNKCPKLSNSTKKSSRIQILNEATVYIKQIKDKNNLLEDTRMQERQRNEELKARLISLGGC